MGAKYTRQTSGFDSNVIKILELNKLKLKSSG